MIVFPDEVDINEDQLGKLQLLYKTAYKTIVSEMEGATDFGIANRRAILAQIQTVLEELGVAVGAFIETEIPDYYETGAKQAVDQLDEVNAPLRIKMGFNSVHKMAINSLVSDTAEAFGQSLTGVNRSANRMMSEATKQAMTQKLAEGQISGSPNKQIARNLKTILREQGLDALVDKSGRLWTLDRYADMLIRTKAVEARNTGFMNRIVENEYDLVEVSKHGADDVCGDWEGKILSLTGKTKEFMGKAIHTLDYAKSEGLFHPNCKHAINVLNPTLAQRTRAYDTKKGKYGKPGEGFK